MTIECDNLKLKSVLLSFAPQLPCVFDNSAADESGFIGKESHT